MQKSFILVQASAILSSGITSTILKQPVAENACREYYINSRKSKISIPNQPPEKNKIFSLTIPGKVNTLCSTSMPLAKAASSWNSGK